jgi:4-hydroxy-tetrahydrodipicolinate reductase
LIDIILHGCNGKMGKVLQHLIESDENMNVVAGIDKGIVEPASFKLYGSSADCEHKADVLIDFSHHSAIADLLEYCVRSKTPVVIATTALGITEIALIKEASVAIPVFRSANMSLGINILAKALKQITPVLEAEFNVEIIEKHHSRKLDSPSGTALLLADAINSVCTSKKDYVYGRHSTNDQCLITDLGIHAVRGGTIPGEHTIIFAGPDEVIEITHTALSREIFARGALKAATFLASAKPGLYSMEDLI